MNKLLALVVVLAAAAAGYTYLAEQKVAQAESDTAAQIAAAEAEAAAKVAAEAEAAAQAAAELEAAAAEAAAQAAAEAEAAAQAAAVAEAAAQAAAEAEAAAQAAAEAEAAAQAAAEAEAAAAAETAAAQAAAAAETTFVNVHAAIDRSGLDAAGKAALKAAVDAARSDPEALRAVLEEVKAAMALEVHTFVNVEAAIDHTGLDAAAKEALKARVEGAKDDPEALKAALEEVKAAIAATPATPDTPFINVVAAIDRSTLDAAGKQALKDALVAANGNAEALKAVLEEVKAALTR
jgi:hypothetical protein